MACDFCAAFSRDGNWSSLTVTQGNRNLPQRPRSGLSPAARRQEEARRMEAGLQERQILGGGEGRDKGGEYLNACFITSSQKQMPFQITSLGLQRVWRPPLHWSLQSQGLHERLPGDSLTRGTGQRPARDAQHWSGREAWVSEVVAAQESSHMDGRAHTAK